MKANLYSQGMKKIKSIENIFPYFPLLGVKKNKGEGGGKGSERKCNIL